MTSTDVERAGAGSLTIRGGQHGFTDQQVAALHQLGVEDASPADLDIFFHQAVRTGLDPFARQIYMIGRRSKNRNGVWVTKQTIQTGIDGFRLIARRAADARHETFSMDDTLWADAKGIWHDLWIWDTPPAAAKTTVHVGEAMFSAVAATREYMPTTREGAPAGQWRVMPAVMIAKCSEALALRKAFPMDLSGVYTGEEMQQADTQAPSEMQVESQRQAPAPAYVPVAERSTAEQGARIREYAEALGLDDATLGRTVTYVTRRDVNTEAPLSDVEASQVIAYLRERYEQQHPDSGEVVELPFDDGGDAA